MYCLCVYVYCTTATGWLPNCSYQIYKLCQYPGLLPQTTHALKSTYLRFAFLSCRISITTNSLTHSREQSPWEANRFSASQEIPHIWWNPKFITAFTSARHLSLSSATSIQAIPSHPPSLRSILILFSHLRLGLPSGPFPSGFHIKILYTPLFSPIRATCPAHLILIDFITRTMLGEQYDFTITFLKYQVLKLPVFITLACRCICLKLGQDVTQT